jgi:hypothetical protein
MNAAAAITLNPAQVEQHIATRGYTPAQGRVGVTVWRTPGGKRAKFELTMSTVNGVTWLHEYALTPSRRRIAGWMVNC